MLKTYLFYTTFLNDKEKLYVHVGFNLTRSSIFHINYLSCAKCPSGFSVTELLYPNWSTEWCGFETCYWLFHFSFFFRIRYAFSHWFENQYFCCHFKVVLLMLFNNKYTIHVECILRRKWDLRWIMVLISYFDSSYLWC